MPEIGLLSGSAEEKEYGYAPRSRVYAGPDWGWQTEESFKKIQEQQSSPLGMLNGAVRFVSDAYQQTSQAIYDVIPKPISSAIDAVVEPVSQALEQGYASTPMGMAEEGAVQLGENIGSTLGNTTLGAATGFLLGAVIPGPGEGLAFSRGAAKTQLIKRSQEVEKLATKIQEYRAIGKTSRIGKTEAKLSSAQSNILPATPENPKVYPANLVEAQKLVKAEKLKRQTTETLHLHHKLPKGMSAAFIDRMDYFISKGKATTDDLLEMADEATKIGLTTGDLRSNILPIADKPHTTLHTEMRAMGSGMFGRMELGKKELMAAMREAKDPTSLKALWKAWINDDAKYLVETAEVWEPLDNLLKEIRSK